jgi:hypothetical protein
MTPEEKHIFQLFPENETVRRADILIDFLKTPAGKRHEEKGFIKTVTKLQKTEVIEFMGLDDDGMYLRRRTTEEIREIYFNK